jgi:hypothetical protein
VTEKIFAGYLMGTMYFDHGNIVAGLRAERVDNTGLPPWSLSTGRHPGSTPRLGQHAVLPQPAHQL